MLRGFRQSYDSGDKSAALRQLETAAEQGNVAARWKAARMLADGDGVQRDDYRAFRHFARIVERHGEEGRESINAGAVADSLVALGVYWRNGIKASPCGRTRPRPCGCSRRPPPISPAPRRSTSSA